MYQYYDPEPPVRENRRMFILRVALIAALAGAIWALQTGTGTRSPLEDSWRTPTASPLQGDILYRLGTHLQTRPRPWLGFVDLDFEAVAQSGVAVYERLALDTDAPDPQALYRLAVIYARQGYPDEGIKLLRQLVMLEPTSADLYYAVSSVYDTASVKREQLREAVPVFQAHDDWVTRLVLVDFYRRLGDEGLSADTRTLAARRDAAFAAALAAICVVYGLLGLAGFALLIRFAYVKLFTIRPTIPPIRVRVGWTVFDAVEVVAVLLLGMIVVGLLSGLVIDKLELERSARWALPLVTLVSYLVFSIPALLLVRHRALGSMRSKLRALGLGVRLDGRRLVQGVAGYAVMLALLVVGALAFKWAGFAEAPLAAESAIELLQHARSVPEILVYVVLLCVVAPIVEETIFRGFVYAGLRQRYNMPFAVIISSLLFGAAHLSLAIGGMLSVAVIGVLLAYLYERSRVLWPSIVAHSLHNLLALCLVISASL